MTALGDLPACDIEARQVERLLRTISDNGASPRTVNWYRSTLRAIINYGAQPTSGYGLTRNPAAETRPRREDGPGPLEVFSVGEIEALARAAGDGSWLRATEVSDGVDRRLSAASWGRSPSTVAA